MVLDGIIKAIETEGGRCFKVGGCVRDGLLGIEPKDIDVEVFSIGIDALIDILSTFGKVDMVGASFGVLKLRIGIEDFDFSLPRRDSKTAEGHKGFTVTTDAGMSLAEAAARRDFTINAISMASDGSIQDPYGGAADLAARILRHVSLAFAEDPLRVLRGIQFASRYNLTAAASTVAMCRSLIDKYPTLAVERVWGEWEKWATKGVMPSRGLAFLQRTGWIAHYPELAAMVGLPQEYDWHPEGSVWQHTKHVCDAAARIAKRDGLDAEDRLVFMFGALCHDMGKVTTTAIINGRITSHGHDVAGVAPTESFMRSIGAPERIVVKVAELTRYHMIHVNGEPTARTARRLVAKIKVAPAQLFRLIEADHSGRPPLPRGLPVHAQTLQALVAEIGDTVPPMLTGQHLIDHGWQTGPFIGVVLRSVYERQLNGEIINYEGALAAAIEMGHQRNAERLGYQYNG